MAFVGIGSTLTPAVSIRLINSTKGRGLFAEQDFEAGAIVLKDKPLVSMQHVKNRIVSQTCANCYRFLGSLEHQLTYLSTVCEMKLQKNFQIPKMPKEKDVSFATQIVECPLKCGEKYCSAECQQNAFNTHHQLLCVGPIDDYLHPLVVFKKYAIENNELFLLAAQLIVKIILHYKATGSREGTDILSHLHHRAWWDVVIPNKTVEHAQKLDTDLRRMLTESLDLLTQAILQPILVQYPTAQIQDLFTMDFYTHLIGMLEMYDNTIEIKSPLQKYLENINCLPQAQQTRVTSVLHPLREKLSVMQDDDDCDDHDEEGEEEPDEDMADGDDEGDQIEELEIPMFDGVGVFTTEAMSNHSCDPNCIAKFDNDNTLLFVAKRKILKGEELTHSYIDDDLSLDERREDLKEYGFWCDCTKCEKEEAEAKAKAK